MRRGTNTQFIAEIEVESWISPAPIFAKINT
jgi:hypothetical protein